MRNANQLRIGARELLLALLLALAPVWFALAQEDEDPEPPGNGPVQESPLPPGDDEDPEDPETPQPPDAEEPETPEPPDAEEPDAEEPEGPLPPDADEPDADEPEVTDPPDADEPDVTDPAAADDPDADAEVTDLTAATSRVIQINDPIAAGMRDFGDAAWVRVINLSPGTDSFDFAFVSTDPEAPAPSLDTHLSVPYEGLGGYEQFAPGQYEVRLPGGEVENFSLSSGRYYTLVLHGLELPADVAAEDNGGGLFAWIGGLFGNDTGADRFAADVLLLEDNLYQFEMGSSVMLRVLNAAPGVGSASVAVRGESGRLTGESSYGAATGFSRVDPVEFSGPLELRIDGSRVVTIDLSEVNLAAGSINTVYLVGTPIEDAPLRAVVVSTPSFGD